MSAERLPCITALLLGFGICRATAGGFAPFVLDVAALDSNQVRHAAQSALTEPITTIVDKPRPSPSGDPRDYVSYGRYWWPDPGSSNGLPYIRRDGYPNRKQMEMGDEVRLNGMIKSVEALAHGWELEHNNAYAQRAGDWIRAWFITHSTRVRPEFEYAQIRLGHDNNRGSPSGLIQTRGFIRFIDALRMLEESPALNPDEEQAVENWFSDYLHWLTTSTNGQLEHRAPNNHGSWYLAQCIAISRYLQRPDTARKFAKEDFARIANQFEPDGSQPLELARADSLSYSVFNLEAQFTIAKLASPLGVDLCGYESPGGGSLRKGLLFVRRYERSPESWPQSQLRSIDPEFMRPLLQLAESACPNIFTTSPGVDP